MYARMRSHGRTTSQWIILAGGGLACLKALTTMTEAFSMTTNHHCRRDATVLLLPRQANSMRGLHSLKSTSKDDMWQHENTSSRKTSDFFFEEAAQNAGDKIAAMSIAERTKRVMLAEAVEDRIVLLGDELDCLLGENGMPSQVEHRDEVEHLAREIKTLREQYRLLVSGSPSPILNAIDGTMEGTMDDDDASL